MGPELGHPASCQCPGDGGVQIVWDRHGAGSASVHRRRGDEPLVVAPLRQQRIPRLDITNDTQARSDTTTVVRTFHHRQFDADPSSVSVVVPARECARTIGHIVRSLVPLGLAQLLVVDADSHDGTAALAAAEGAAIVSENDLLPEFGPCVGKGDAMWRALSVCTGDVVCFIDGDSGPEFGPHFVTGTVGPLQTVGGTEFVKAFFRRPLGEDPEGGGRVTELMARPLLRRFWPELGALHQPLAGEMAARLDLLRSLPFATGYAIETALLLDVYERVGATAIAQVDLEVRRNDHQPLSALAGMADEVLAAASVRLGLAGESPLQRPPMRDVLAAAA